jgi:uncharacterized protein (DUF58 family)
MRWFIGCFLLLLAALILESGLLAYAMYVLLGLLIVSRLMARSWLGNLHAERSCDKTAVAAGATVTVDLVVHNRGFWPVPWLLMEDLLPARALIENRARLRLKKKRIKIAMLGIRGQTKLSYQILFMMRGYYQVGPLVLESGDLFGLHRRYHVLTEPAFVLVYPKVIPLAGYELASRRPIGEVMLTHRLYEDPTRIAGVRQYEAGDPLNRVHWGATARTGVLHSKIYEPSTIAGATLLLDFHQAGFDDRREPQRSELAVTAAASLACALYQMGQQVGLMSNGRDAADRIRAEGWTGDFRTRGAAQKTAAMREDSDRLRPVIVETRRGVEQFQRILEALARLEMTDGLTFAQMIPEITSRLPRDATVVAFLAEASEDTALALGNLRRRGFAVTAIPVIFTDDELGLIHGRLAAEGVEVRPLKNEAALPTLCQRYVVR